MAEMSNYLENALINATLRNTTYTSPTTVYVALFTSDPVSASVGSVVYKAKYTFAGDVYVVLRKVALIKAFSR